MAFERAAIPISPQWWMQRHPHAAALIVSNGARILEMVSVGTLNIMWHVHEASHQDSVKSFMEVYKAAVQPSLPCSMPSSISIVECEI